MQFDQDLQSIQEARDLVKRAKAAQKIVATYDQEKVDAIVAAMARAGEAAAERLARMAVDETGFGVFEDKITKNLFASRDVYRYIKDMKTAGIVAEDKERKVLEIAEPVGVICGIVPSTNPTSTTIFKSLISVKGRNGIVISPHPSAVNCSREAARIMEEAAVKAGAPEGIIGCLSIPSMKGTEELMHHRDVAVILATGGSAMVKAAYSAGKPAYGVGPGNVPAYIDKSADVPRAVSHIIRGKTFDNGTICASEQAVVMDRPIREQAMTEFKRQGVYFLNPEETRALERVMVKPGGGLNPGIVGRPARTIASMAGLPVPEGTRVLGVELTGVGRDYPLSMEKLSPVLAFYTEDGWEAGCHRCIELLQFGGIGHSLVLHARDEKVIREFALKKPVFRVMVNTPAALGAIGATTGLAPSLTLGCGTWGGNATSDNVTPRHLINIKRLAYGLEPEAQQPVPAASDAGVISEEVVSRIVAEVIHRLNIR